MPNGIDQLNSDELDIAFADCLDSMTKTFAEAEDDYLNDMALHMNSLYEIICEKHKRMKHEQSDIDGIPWQGPRDKAH